MRSAMRPIRLFAGIGLGVFAGWLLAAAPAHAGHRPEFQMPFACGETWGASTRYDHSPSQYAVDWNRDAYDEGHIVVATAPGTVTAVVDLGNTSYGLYIVVDHGADWTTLHAHLLKTFVVEGQRVDEGQPIALLGTSGGSTGAHLHYEQRLGGTDKPAVFNAQRLAYNSSLTSRNCVDVGVVGDWNGDKTSSVGVFGRHAKKGTFVERLPGGAHAVARLGLPTDTPVIGDWNGDGRSDPGVWRSATHQFIRPTAPRSDRVISFGKAADLPVAGDWDGDGRDDVGVFHPATGRFSLRVPAGTVSTGIVGGRGSWPVAGDWNGDGRTEVGVYDPATTTFSLALDSGSTRQIVFGTSTSLPVVGYWGSDARSDVGVWEPSTGVFTKRLSPHRTQAVRFGHRR